MPKWKVVARVESFVIVEAPEATLAVNEAGHIWDGERFPNCVPDVKFFPIEIEEPDEGLKLSPRRKGKRGDT